MLRSNSKKAKILDSKGRVIFFRNLKKEGEKFSVNLPREGVYSFTGAEITKDLPLVPNSIKFELPAPEREGLFKPFKIVENLNEAEMKGTPARIFPLIGKIEVSAKFKSLPPQIRLFILLHEMGHFFYKTEWKTDTFALYYYLKMGYNSSQALYALTRILHPTQRNFERINKLFKKVQR
jgi:hypothetical protein